MNIRQAKEEIKNAVRSYLKKDRYGNYEIPVERQRPILLIGPPGIGKTAIMEQAAKELKINLVSYTITHHTRQSAIGLPFLSEREYGGVRYSVTEYTMSEIIGSIYDQIERSGVKEGILFLDEINCVSETLIPTMLQFLQYKTFGAHRVPEGFLIVTAGNPPEYNASVRDFDIVTLDRVRRIEVREDLPAWREYADRAGIHGSILTYLDLKKDHFYSVRQDMGEKYFVTARGWEDLSRILFVHEELGLPVTKELILQYLQDPEIAGDFSTYYELNRKYKEEYRIREILEGSLPEEAETLKNAPFDEKLTLIGLLIDALNREFRESEEMRLIRDLLFKNLQGLKDELKAASLESAEGAGAGSKAASGEPASGTPAALRLLEKRSQAISEQLRQDKKIRMLTEETAHSLQGALSFLGEARTELIGKGTGDPRADYGILRDWYNALEEKRLQEDARRSLALTHSFEFLEKVYGEGQELVIFLTGLSRGYYSLKFVSLHGNDTYYRYNSLLLLSDRERVLKEEAAAAMGSLTSGSEISAAAGRRNPG